MPTAPPPHPTAGSPALPGIDGLRGVAALAVLAYHVFRPGPGRPLCGGFLAVDTFFALSGFLITYLLAREWDRAGGVRLGRFWGRRACRLGPAMLALMLACDLAFETLPDPVQLRAVRATNAGLITTGSYRWAEAPSPYLTHVWPLTTAVYFDLIWPLVLVALLRLRAPRPAAAAVAVLGFLGSWGFRAFLRHGMDNPGGLPAGLAGVYPIPESLYLFPETHSDGLWLGAVAGLCAAWGWVPRGGRGGAVVRAAGLTGVAPLVGLVTFLPAGRVCDYAGFALAAGCATAAVVALATGQAPGLGRVLSLPPLTWAGRVSFGLYLWHWPILVAVSAQHDADLRNGAAFGLSVVASRAFVLAASLVAAELSYRFIEQPFLRPSAGPATATAGPAAEAAAPVPVPVRRAA